MEIGTFLTVFAVMTVVQSGILLLVILIGKNWADLSMPPLGQLLLRVIVISAVTMLVDLLLSQVMGILGWAGSLVVFWYMMYKWFNCDLFGAVILIVISFVLRMLIGIAILGAIVSATS
jgi:hypothetical protein